MILATWITRQVVFNGVVSGLVFGLIAMGIVLIYRSTRVINFAVGNMGLPASALFALMILEYEFPFWIAAAIALVVGTGFGMLLELIVVRRLFTAPRVILLVATIGMAQLSLAVVASLPDVDDSSARFPNALGTTYDDVLGLRIKGTDIQTMIVVPIIALVLGLVMTRTRFGRMVSASADNGDLARLSGISPKKVSTLVWTIAGFVASLSMLLLGSASGNVSQLSSLGPSTLARGLAAAVLAGMVSFPRAMGAGVLLGIIESVVGFNFFDQPGLIDFLLLVAIVIAVFLQSRGDARTEGGSFSFAPKVKPVPAVLQDRWWVRNLGRIVFAAMVVVAALVPVVIDKPSRHFIYASILCFAIAAISVTIITGWAGQLSLGQMAFAGIGAFGAAAFVRGAELDVGIGGVRLDVTFPAVPFVAALVLGALLAAGVAVLLGLGALRVRGLLLAVVTFGFALASQQYLYRRPFFTGGSTGSVPFQRGEFFGIDLSEQRTYYWFCLGALVLVVGLVSRMRRTGPGRTTIAVRDNADTAAVYTVGATRSKLGAFALSGGIAGFAGALIGGLVQSVRAVGFFEVSNSLQLIAMVVIGGLGSIAGPIIGALWVVGLPAFFPGNDLVPLFTSSLGLLILLLYFPGGLVQIGYAMRDALFVRLAARQPAPERTRSTVTPTLSRRERTDDQDGQPVLVADDVFVTFGGLAAVNHASIEVRPDEVVGLIGTNGAGKSTLLNAIGGYVPSRGKITVEGVDVSSQAAHIRARVGFGRTFQAATLFPELTVRETVMVALEGRGRSGVVSTAVGWPPAVRNERRMQSESRELIDFLGLGAYADQYVSDLSTGTRRIVELAGLLALDAKILCLDEPTAGVAQRETEAFGPLMLEIRRELGAAMLIIEHDMPLIMSLSDRVYCLEQGAVISHGEPNEVRNDPLVVASYLGTDDRAIDRSDSVAT